MNILINLAFTALSMLSFVAGQDLPEITQTILPEIKRAGETGMLNCTITRQGQNLVNWVHMDNPSAGQLFISSDETVTLPDYLNPVLDGHEKYEVLKHVNSFNQLTTYTLKVWRLGLFDNGTYRCQVNIQGTSDKVLKDGDMIVMVPPSIVSASTTQTVTKQEGADILLSCKANANPSPMYKWVRPNGKALPLPGSPFSIQNNTLQLTNIRREDRGVYRCIADNNVPPAGVYDATLYIQFAPSARAVQTTYGQIQNRQYDVTLECRISGFPEPDLQWYKEDDAGNTEPLRNDDFHDIYILYSHGQELSINEIWFQLTIRNVRGNDYGKYRCEGRNTLGRHYAIVKLYETSMCQGPNCIAEALPSSAHVMSAALTSAIITAVTLASLVAKLL